MIGSGEGLEVVSRRSGGLEKVQRRSRECPEVWRRSGEGLEKVLRRPRECLGGEGLQVRGLTLDVIVVFVLVALPLPPGVLGERPPFPILETGNKKRSLTLFRSHPHRRFPVPLPLQSALSGPLV